MSLSASADPAQLCVTPEAPAAEAARMIAARRIGAIPVQDRAGRMVGLVSEHDIVRVVATRALGLRGLAVEEVMSRDVLGMQPGTPPEAALELMRQHDLRHLPLCCADGRVIGLVSVEDLIRPS